MQINVKKKQRKMGKGYRHKKLVRLKTRARKKLKASRKRR